MKKALFIDRDGTLIIEPEDQQIDDLSKLDFYPGVFTWLGKIARETDFELVMVTNQDGLGTPSFPEETFWPAHHRMMQTFANEGINFKDVLIDRSFRHENKPTRKPGTGLLGHYLTGAYDLANSWVIGDRITDLQLARNMGCHGILITSGSKNEHVKNENTIFEEGTLTGDWEFVYQTLVRPQRRATIARKTNETDITISVNLDGNGRSDIHTGIGFFDHMLDQLARHGSIDLAVSVSGDLRVDEHHTIEDTALALGQAFLHALGDKRGIFRYGFLLPMDDCLAQVAIDFGGRPWLVWDADFKREKIGEMPTEMFFHFFKSFTDAAKCNLNIKAEGDNEHHKIESIFKAFAKSIQMAINRTGSALPSTKGVL